MLIQSLSKFSSCRRISTQCPPVNNTEHRVCNTFAIRQYSARLLMHINDSSNLTSVRSGGENTMEILHVCWYIFWCKTLLMMTSVSQCPRSNAIHLAMISAAANTLEHVRTQQYYRMGSDRRATLSVSPDRSKKGPNLTRKVHKRYMDQPELVVGCWPPSLFLA